MHRSRPLWLAGAALMLALAVQAGAGAAPAQAAGKRRGELTLDAGTSLSLGKRLEARGDNEGALGLYQKALTENPNDLEALRALVGLAVRTGRAGLVPDEAARLAARQPDDMAAQVWLAASLNERRQPQEALAVLARAETATANPVPGLLWTQRGIAHDLLGAHLEAQRAFSQAVTLAPGERALPMRVALSLALQEDYPAALRILQTQVNDPVMEQPVRETLAIIYALSGQTDTALEIARTAVPGVLAETQRAYFAALPGLPPAAKAFAAHFRRIPQDALGARAVPVPDTERQAERQPEHRPGPEAGIDVFEVAPTSVADPAAEPQPAPEPQPVPVPPAEGAGALPEPKLVRVAESMVPAQRVSAQGTPEQAAPEQAAPEKAVPANSYWLQLASLHEPGRLDPAWRETTARAPDLLAGRTPYFEAQTVKGSPVYRLMLGPFASFAEARDMAGKLGASGIKSVIRRNVADIEPLKRQ